MGIIWDSFWGIWTGCCKIVLLPFLVCRPLHAYRGWWQGNCIASPGFGIDVAPVDGKQFSVWVVGGNLQPIGSWVGNQHMWIPEAGSRICGRHSWPDVIPEPGRKGGHLSLKGTGRGLASKGVVRRFCSLNSLLQSNAAPMSRSLFPTCSPPLCLSTTNTLSSYLR